MTREDVFTGGVLQETARGDDPDRARINLAFRDNSGNSPEVVDVCVGENDRHDRLAGEMGLGQFPRGSSGGCRCQGVDDDPPRIAFYETHVRQITTADLVDAVADFEQPADRIQLRLTPQAGIDGIGWGTVQKVELRGVPYLTARIVEDGLGG